VCVCMSVCLYVCLSVCLSVSDEVNAEETLEFSTIPSEASVLAAFVQKSTVD